MDLGAWGKTCKYGGERAMKTGAAERLLPLTFISDEI